jgi:Flp pilus assembly protein TadG
LGVKRHTPAGQDGQILALCSVFLVVLMGMAALTIDVGGWLLQKRGLQGAVDAAALAGASQLPAGFSTAQTSASSYFTKNSATGTATVTSASTYTSNDSVKVTATTTAKSYFSKVFGMNSVTITVTATATVRSVTSYQSTGNVMPFGVMKGNYTPGTSYTIFGDGSSSNNGALSLDLVSGQTCATANGANDLRNTIDGSQTACKLTVTDTLATKTGNNTGAIAQGLNTRMSGGWQSFNQIVAPVGNGEYQLVDANSKQLVIIPIVTNTAGGTTWPNGAGQIKVVGFAYFVITGCGNPTKPGPCSNSDGKYVNGTFVQLVDSSSVPADTGAYDPSNGTMTTVALSS